MYRFAKSLLIGIPVGITVFDYVGYIARVEGISMQPALNPNNCTDYVFLSRTHILRQIQKQDIVSCISPKNRNQIIIKRVIATEGEVIAADFPKSSQSGYFKIPDGHCWIEGDHKEFSLDSKTFGPVPLGLINAKATCIVWPPKRWQLL